MRRSAPFLTIALVAGCALAGPPRPETVRLSPQVLTVVMQDGTVCRADWPAAPEGRMDDCGVGYQVLPEGKANPIARVWQDVWRALEADGAIQPQARVLVTDAGGGTHVFASPAPVRD